MLKPDRPLRIGDGLVVIAVYFGMSCCMARQRGKTCTLPNSDQTHTFVLSENENQSHHRFVRADIFVVRTSTHVLPCSTLTPRRCALVSCSDRNGLYCCLDSATTKTSGRRFFRTKTPSTDWISAQNQIKTILFPFYSPLRIHEIYSRFTKSCR